MKATRIAIYCLGNLFLALGFIFNVKSGLGVSPINGIAYCVSVFTDMSFPDLTMCLFILFFIIAVLLRRKLPHWTDLLQLPYCVLFSRCMSAIAALMPEPQSLAVKIIFLILGFMCVGTGAALSLSMHIIPNPTDYMVNIIGNRIHKPLGLTKNIVDVVIVASTCITGLLAGLSIPEAGVNIGTVVATIFTGRWIALVNHFFLKKLNHIYKSGYIKVFDDKEDEMVAD